MRVVVPYAERAPKTRLAPALHAAERTALARCMLADVLDAVRAAGHEPEVVAPEPVPETETVVDERPLTDAINDLLASAAGPVAVVMADLALADGASLSRLFSTPGDVVVAAGRGGGTNALVVRHPEFRVDYHGASYLDHRRIARGLDLDVVDVDSRRLASDVDEPADLVEILVHGRRNGGETRSYRWLVNAGFSLRAAKGRVGIERGRERYS